MIWPFRSREKKKSNIAKKVVVGMIVGGAIGSIVGRKLMEKHNGNDEDEDDENGFKQHDV